MSGVRYWTADRIIGAFNAWAERHGRLPSRRDWYRAGPEHPADPTVRSVFGGWTQLLTAAGHQARPTGRPVSGWTRETVCHEIFEWAVAHDGALPTWRDWVHAAEGRPSSSVVERLFGSWSGALVAAGYEPSYTRRSARSLRAVMAHVTRAAA